MKLKFFRTLFCVVVFMLLSTFLMDLMAQCPMCKMAAESNLDHGGTAGKGLNKGILFMLSMPYILVASLGLIWYRHRRKGEHDDIIPS